MRGTIWAGLAAGLLAAGCASAGGDKDACAQLEAACHAQCDREFESRPSSWDYQSCLNSCRPDPGAICVE